MPVVSPKGLLFVFWVDFRFRKEKVAFRGINVCVALLAGGDDGGVEEAETWSEEQMRRWEGLEAGASRLSGSGVLEERRARFVGGSNPAGSS